MMRGWQHKQAASELPEELSGSGLTSSMPTRTINIDQQLERMPLAEDTK